VSVIAEQLIREFQEILGVAWHPSSELLGVTEDVISICGDSFVTDESNRRRNLLALVNRKFRLNKERYQNFLNAAASQKIYLNYHDKSELLECLDTENAERLGRLLSGRGFNLQLQELLKPVSPAETLDALAAQLRNGTVNRRDARQCGVAERRESILRSLFGGYVFCCFDQRAMHSCFNSDCQVEYFPDYYQHLKRFHPTVLNRECALIFAVINDALKASRDKDSSRDEVFDFIRQSYDRLSNHCYLAIQVKPSREDLEDDQWRLFSDVVLYAEKHREVRLKTGYFHPKKIEQATKEHISNINLDAAKFEIANEGFFFRDCIVLSQQSLNGHTGTTSEPVDLLLLFQKNERDETLIPCPACRAFNVAGNSYPVLGVRSWECQNPLCPERSAFDRGNRYSLESLIKQEAIKSEEDQIPEWSLKKWKLDVVAGADESAIVDMLLRHFSLHKDTVVFVNSSEHGTQKHGRSVTYELFPTGNAGGLYEQFNDSCFFHRFTVKRDSEVLGQGREVVTDIDGVRVFQGDCFEVLSQFDTNSLDGAITSPPYYNARSYALWQNIYCYLHDVYNVARQVYRVLKPGSVFLFNIFDYFDNENNVAFSSMGKKRMILGAYIVNLFRRVGFKLDRNIVWFKGEIEGKRNYNQGNHSPYYQLPFNCWEHVFVFRKPEIEARDYQFPQILSAKPVFKIQGGKNVLGHSAPFPAAIPELLLAQMNVGESVVDPYSGSMTTGRAAFRHGINSVSIDLHLKYCELGLRLLREEVNQKKSLEVAQMPTLLFDLSEVG
jgi:DNA modification methylase